jgi:integrase
MSKLTKRTVEAAKKGEREQFVWDGELRGFGLRVLPSGVKTFVVQYRNGSGASRRLALGRFGVLTAESARDLARDRLEQVRKGRDPSAERTEARKAATIAELAQRFVDEHAKAKRKPSTYETYKWLAPHAITPKLGAIKVRDLTREQVARWHAGLSDTPTQANRALALLAKILNWAIAHGHRPDEINPARGVEKFPEAKRERFLSADEFKRLGDAIARAEREATEPVHALAALRLLAVSGMRLGEVLNLRHAEISFERGFLELPDSKTGRKSVPLTAPMAEILNAVPKVEGNQYVFAGRKDGQRLVGIQRIWRRVAKAAALDDARIHDLRHSLASVGAAGGLSLPIIGKLLGHSQPQTTARYAHLAADPVRAAAETVAARVAGMMAGRAAEVVPLGAKRRS